MSDKKVVVYGASGYTGRLVCEFLREILLFPGRPVCSERLVSRGGSEGELPRETGAEDGSQVATQFLREDDMTTRQTRATLLALILGVSFFVAHPVHAFFDCDKGQKGAFASGDWNGDQSTDLRDVISLVEALYSDDQIEQVVSGTPLKRMTSYAETAAFIKLLAGDSTAFVTGQTIMFDGGRNMR